jgi:4-hydroxybenzoate polyprenyltransferase
MIRFSHSVFALPFALIATFLAGAERPGGLPSAVQVGLILVCMVAARSAAMTFNRIVDRRLDARNPRTAGRALVTGRISVWEAGAFFVACCAVFLAGCAGFYWAEGNVWPVVLGVPVLVYLCAYSYAKRVTHWSHLLLGSAIALSPPAAWLAIDPGSIGWAAVVLMAGVTCWIGGFDIIYACQDVEADRRDGLHSLPARLGVGRALWIARGAHAVTVALLGGLAWLTPLGWVYLVGVGVVAVLLVVENALVRADDLSRVGLAFFTVNGVVSVLLAGFAIGDLLHR